MNKFKSFWKSNISKAKDEPEPGKIYALTGGPDDRAISNGNSWAESEVKEDKKKPEGKPKKKSSKGIKKDAVDDIMAYEDGSLSEASTIKMFQRMIDSGQIYNLQGSYYRAARDLQEEGKVHGLKIINRV